MQANRPRPFSSVDPRAEDNQRRELFRAAGMTADQSAALVAFIRDLEDNADPTTLARKKTAILDRLVRQGMATYDAFVALFCKLV